MQVRLDALCIILYIHPEHPSHSVPRTLAKLLKDETYHDAVRRIVET